jgi:hypothetical protein
MTALTGKAECERATYRLLAVVYSAERCRVGATCEVHLLRTEHQRLMRNQSAWQAFWVRPRCTRVREMRAFLREVES